MFAYNYLLRNVLNSYKSSLSAATRSAVIDGVPQRTPGLVPKFMDLLPVRFGQATFFGDPVAQGHGFSAILRMFVKAAGGHLIDFRGQFASAVTRSPESCDWRSR